MEYNNTTQFAWPGTQSLMIVPVLSVGVHDDDINNVRVQV